MTNTTLTPATPRDRATIMRYATRYAVVCTLDGHQTTIGFSGRLSKHTLLTFARSHADAILPFVTEQDRCSYRARVLTLGPRVTLSFGDTERRAS